MNFPSLIQFCIIWSAILVSAQTSSSSNDYDAVNSTRESLNQQIHHQKQQINHNASLENRSYGITGAGSWKHKLISHKRQRLRSIHGTVNIIGWGVLLPVGVIIARYFKKQSNDWYALHILSQFSGFLLGALGWGLGMSIKNEAKEHSMSTHGILGTIIFAFATLQVYNMETFISLLIQSIYDCNTNHIAPLTLDQLLAMCLQPDEAHDRRKYWVIYHHAVGYALIILIIANIFQGINNQSAAKKWEWFYGAILGVLGMSAIALEVLRWIYN